MNKEIIDKIKKLLRMKRGGSQAEIETALSMAAKLARDHGIDMATVNPDEASEERVISHEDAVKSGRIQWDQKYPIMICQRFFNVTTLLRAVGFRDMRATFIGTSSDIQIAIYVFRFLVGHFRRCWNRRTSRIRNRQAFLYGMYLGLSNKLREQEPPETENASAVLIVKTAIIRRKDYMVNTFGKTKQSSVDPGGNANHAKWAGFIEGQKTNIRPAVKSPVTQTSLLLGS